MRLLFATAMAAAMLIAPASAAGQDPVPAAPMSQPTAEGTTPTTGKATPSTEQDKIKDCAAKWKAAKTAGTTNGQSHRKFKKACLKNA